METDAPPPSNGEDQTWHFRGYNMSPGEFNTAMVHLYRGEVSRSNTWRTRLDATTNWAVITTAALLTFAFGGPQNHHVVLLMGIGLNLIFLTIEARRYRYYELWALRVRLMETDFFAAMLAPPFAPGKDWARRLNETLLTPQFPIGEWEALGRRLRRNFLGLFLLILASWVIKLAIHPAVIHSPGELVARATVGPISGQIVIAAVAVGYSFMILAAIITAGLQEAPGEVLPRYDILDFSGNLWSQLWPLKPKKHLSIIITDHGQAVADEILTRINRGVTALKGTGMYTQTDRSVLLSAITAPEIAHLKAVVNSIDPDAFVVVNAAEQVFGLKFGRLRPVWQKAVKKRERAD